MMVRFAMSSFVCASSFYTTTTKDNTAKKTRKVVPLLLYGDFFATRLDLIHVGKKAKDSFCCCLLHCWWQHTHTHTDPGRVRGTAHMKASKQASKQASKHPISSGTPIASNLHRHTPTNKIEQMITWLHLS